MQIGNAKTREQHATPNAMTRDFGGKSGIANLAAMSASLHAIGARIS
jgi:hypothetical protein